MDVHLTYEGKNVSIVRWCPKKLQVEQTKDSPYYVYKSESFVKLTQYVSTYCFTICLVPVLNFTTLRLTMKIQKSANPKENRPQALTVYFRETIKRSCPGVGAEEWKCAWTLKLPLEEAIQQKLVFQMGLDFKDPEEQCILKHLSSLFTNQLRTDVKFIIQGQEIGAHLNIISHHPVMASMLNEKFVEGQSRKVFINNIEPEIFRHILHYLYNPVPPLIVEVSKLEQLLVAAEMYQLVGLKQFCEESLIGSVEEDNVVRLLVVAYLQTANRLLETCFDYLSRTSDDFWFRVEWKELMEDYPDLFFQASNRMCVARTP